MILVKYIEKPIDIIVFYDKIFLIVFDDITMGEVYPSVVSDIRNFGLFGLLSVIGSVIVSVIDLVTGDYSGRLYRINVLFVSGKNTGR